LPEIVWTYWNLFVHPTPPNKKLQEIPFGGTIYRMMWGGAPLATKSYFGSDNFFFLSWSGFFFSLWIEKIYPLPLYRESGALKEIMDLMSGSISFNLHFMYDRPWFLNLFYFVVPVSRGAKKKGGHRLGKRGWPRGWRLQLAQPPRRFV
jgi:hypothetical protein